MSGENTRASERVKVEAFVKVSGDDGHQEYVFRTRDLSAGGLFLFTRVSHLYPFFVGAPLHIELYDFDQTVELKGLVVRIVQPGSPEAARYPSGFGVKIVELDDQNRERLERLIERAQRGEEIY